MHIIEAGMSPQYKKPRVSACPAKGKVFKPADIPLTDQEETGSKMGISRGMVERILSDARRKTALALSDCKALFFRKNPVQ